MFNPRKLYLERVGWQKKHKIIHFNKPFIKIGRSPVMDIYLSSTKKLQTVSREQSTIEFRNERMYIYNLSKTNPTFLNDDKVIRETEVEEGDLIGFGSKPNTLYPQFKPEQIFIYKCKSEMDTKKEADEIIDILSEDDEDIVEIPDDDPISLPNKLEKKSNTPVELLIREKSIEILDVPKHFDTIESLKDSSDNELYSSDDEPVANLILKSLIIRCTKLTQEEVAMWKKKSVSRTNSDEDSFGSSTTHSSDNKKSQPKMDKTKYNPLILKSIVDPESDEEYSSIPITSSTFKNQKREFNNNYNDKHKPPSNSTKDKSKTVSNKRRASTSEKDEKVVKKSKISEPTPKLERKIKFLDETPVKAIQKETAKHVEKIKFPDFTSASSRINKLLPSQKPSMTQRRSSHEIKNCSNETKTSNSFIKKRRSSLASSMIKSGSPLRTKPTEPKEMPKCRKTIVETRWKELDIFDIASLMRKEKYPVKSNTENQVETKPYEIKKPLKVSKPYSKRKKAEQEVKKVELKTGAVPPERKKNIPLELLQPVQEATVVKNTNDNTCDHKKFPCVKVKVTQNTRGNNLTEEFLKQLKQPPPRRMSSFNETPSTSVTSFREKYAKTDAISTPNTSKATSYDNYKNIASKEMEQIDFQTEATLDSISVQINKQMQAVHEKLAAEVSIKTGKEDNSPSPLNEDEISDDDTMDDENNGIGFYTSITGTSDINGSPMKDDPRGKTKWINEMNSNRKPEDNIDLEAFPETVNLFASTIVVHHDINSGALKSILKKFIGSNIGQKNRKRVSFNDYSLNDICYFSNEEIPLTSNQQVAHVQPFRQSTLSPKMCESTVCMELLEWNTKWLHLNYSVLPEGWVLQSMQAVYHDLDEYKCAVQKIMNVDLLKKLSNKYKSPQWKNSQWNFLTVMERRDELKGHMKLVLSINEQNDVKQGTLLLMKVRDTSRILQNQEDIYFFGYVTAVYDQGQLKLDAYGPNLPKEMAVIKSKPLMHLRNELKALSAIKCLKDTTLMKIFLNPSLNQMEKNDEKTFNISLNAYDTDKNYLNPEQRVIAKKLIYELMQEKEKIFFINGSAGTGKTYLMIHTILNMIQNLNQTGKKRYIICTSTLTAIDEITEVLSDHTFTDRLKIVRVGFYEKMNFVAKKLCIQDQVQSRMSKTLNASYQKVYKDIIGNADIIICTCRGCYDLLDCGLSFDACFIDEANYCIDAELLFPLNLNIKKLIFVGDVYQLSPTHSPTFKTDYINFSYFSRMLKFYKSPDIIKAPVFTLTIQQRMVRELLEVANKYVYQNSLNLNSSAVKSSYPYKNYVVFTLAEDRSSKYDDEDSLVFFCLKLCEIMPRHTTIGILNGYQSQCNKNKTKFKGEDSLIEFLSIESVQGIEKDVIILMVRKSEMSYFNNFNRINVALTRARKALYIVLNNSVNQHQNEAGLFMNMKDDAKQKKCYEYIQSYDREKLKRILRK